MESVTESRKVRLRVMTPLRVVYDEPVEMVVARTKEGDMGILYEHDTRSALLGDGILRIFKDGRQNEEVLTVLGGIVTVKDNEVAVMSEIAEYPDKMQELLDKYEAERAASEVADQTADLYTKRMEMAIRQALIRMGGAYPVMKNSEGQAAGTAGGTTEKK